MKTHLLLVLFAAAAIAATSCAKDESNDVVIKVGNMVTIEPYKGIKFDMVFVEGGSFYMGAQAENENAPNYDPEARPDESPVHKVTVDGFYIATTEVTQQLWRSVTGEVDFSAQWGNQFPAYSITFDDTKKFIARLNTATGLDFRLPTEAEWEYAARGGKNSRGLRYPGSSNINDVAWYWKNSNDEVHYVAQKQPNELGLYDMSGNVREWCSDWAEYYTSEEQTNPQGPETGLFRIVRGGSRLNNNIVCRITYRNCYNYYETDILTGFRLVLDTAEVNNKILRK